MDFVFAIRQSDSAPTLEKPIRVKPLLALGFSAFEEEENHPRAITATMPTTHTHPTTSHNFFINTTITNYLTPQALYPIHQPKIYYIILLLQTSQNLSPPIRIFPNA